MMAALVLIHPIVTPLIVIFLSPRAVICTIFMTETRRACLRRYRVKTRHIVAKIKFDLQHTHTHTYVCISRGADAFSSIVRALQAN